jgi:hypothetical protein
MGGSLINWPFRQFASMLKALMHANLFDCAFLPTHLSNASSLHRELFLVVSWAPWLQWEPILQQVSPTFRPHHCHFSLSLSAIVDFCAHPNLSLSLSLSPITGAAANPMLKMGGPFQQARNFAVMTGVNAGLTSLMKRTRGIDDIQNA